MADNGVEAVLGQVRVTGEALSRLRRTVERAVTECGEVGGAATPLQFRMEGTGRRVLQTVNSINSSLETILTRIDAAIDDLLDLEENLTN